MTTPAEPRIIFPYYILSIPAGRVRPGMVVQVGEGKNGEALYEEVQDIATCYAGNGRGRQGRAIYVGNSILRFHHAKKVNVRWRPPMVFPS